MAHARWWDGDGSHFVGTYRPTIYRQNRYRFRSERSELSFTRATQVGFDPFVALTASARATQLGFENYYTPLDVDTAARPTQLGFELWKTTTDVPTKTQATQVGYEVWRTTRDAPVNEHTLVPYFVARIFAQISKNHQGARYWGIFGFNSSLDLNGPPPVDRVFIGEGLGLLDQITATVVRGPRKGPDGSGMYTSSGSVFTQEWDIGPSW